MDYGYYCSILDHTNEPIIGFCFYQECDKPKQICFNCFSQLHQRHQNDCLRFDKIALMISDSVKILDNLEKQEQNKMENMINLFKKNLKFISSEKAKLAQLLQQLNNQDCSQVHNQLEQLKQWRNVTLNKYVKNNNIGLQLEEIKKFERSLDQFFQPYLKADTIFISTSEPQAQIGSIERQNSNRSQESPTQPQGLKSESLAVECLTSAVDLYKEDNYQDALNFSNQAIKINSNLEQAYLIKGLCLVHLEQFEEAVDSLNDCLRLNLKIETVYYHKGYSLFVLKQFDEAIECFDRALELKANPDFYLKKAQALMSQEKYNQALESVNRALDIKTKKEYLHLKGAILHKLGNSQEELNCYLAAHGLDPNSSSINHNIGVALHKLERYQEALQYFDAALAVEPDSPDTLNQKGITLLASQSYQKALECFDSALAYKEKPEYLTNKAKTLNFLKRQKEALDIFEYVSKNYGE
ncbi:unnamed protein product (macronuclear) [Paramecium tetraurelia]|uniref:Uncharacterized protein n=1 Tax=Paramecium tetraurelia TaxID=5888 RepID=A0DEH1_PARTE|nr:uncharacterized protein GSPATT00016264001 [Paramecium tetraurelia]CAK81438.1 unnamed protein product [Paramecium tetraurelia]|eukprot:XP_001448835.1 hypothetical protein (macronuclear) [Paramecium tetraurelia strain d4-2]